MTEIFQVTFPDRPTIVETRFSTYLQARSSKGVFYVVKYWARCSQLIIEETEEKSHINGLQFPRSNGGVAHLAERVISILLQIKILDEVLGSIPSSSMAF